MKKRRMVDKLVKQNTTIADKPILDQYLKEATEDSQPLPNLYAETSEDFSTKTFYISKFLLEQDTCKTLEMSGVKSVSITKEQAQVLMTLFKQTQQKRHKQFYSVLFITYVTLLLQEKPCPEKLFESKDFTDEQNAIASALSSAVYEYTKESHIDRNSLLDGADLFRV